jgi:hypothetical protein
VLRTSRKYPCFNCLVPPVSGLEPIELTRANDAEHMATSYLRH